MLSFLSSCLVHASEWKTSVDSANWFMVRLTPFACSRCWRSRCARCESIVQHRRQTAALPIRRPGSTSSRNRKMPLASFLRLLTQLDQSGITGERARQRSKFGGDTISRLCIAIAILVTQDTHHQLLQRCLSPCLKSRDDFQFVRPDFLDKFRRRVLRRLNQNFVVMGQEPNASTVALRDDCFGDGLPRWVRIWVCRRIGSVSPCRCSLSRRSAKFLSLPAPAAGSPCGRA